MEFTLNCPIDGHVELGLEDVSAVIFRDPESLDVVFVCPTCGTSIKAALRVPNLLMAAMELARYAEEVEGGSPREVGRRSRISADAVPDAAALALRAERERNGEPYCEYFRRQLEGVESVEDLLAEFGRD